MSNQILKFLFLFCSFMGFSQQTNLGLNHFYVVLDSADFKKFRDSDFIKNFSSDSGMPDFKKFTPQSTTIYLRLQDTYIELMSPENKFGEEVGKIGLGFSWDTKVYENKILEKQNKDLKFQPFEFSWDFNGTKIPWYTSNYREFGGNLSSWYSFCNPQFLNKLYHTNFDGYKRDYYLKPTFNPSSIFKNIKTLTIECTTETCQNLSTELENFGIIPKKHNEATVFVLKELTLKLENNGTKTNRVRSIEFYTEHPTKIKNYVWQNLFLKN